MHFLTRKRPDTSILPLSNAVFCLDCEVISNTQGDECPACKGRPLVSLARMLGGSLISHRAKQFQQCEKELFDIRITVELQHMYAKDITNTLDKLNKVIGPQLARERGTFHIDVEPTVERLNSQSSLCLPEQDAA